MLNTSNDLIQALKHADRDLVEATLGVLYFSALQASPAKIQASDHDSFTRALHQLIDRKPR